MDELFLLFMHYKHICRIQDMENGNIWQHSGKYIHYGQSGLTPDGLNCFIPLSDRQKKS